MSALLNAAGSKCVVDWDWHDAQTLGHTLNAYPRSLSVPWTIGNALATDVNRVYAMRRTVTAGVTLTLSLIALTDWVGGTITFTKLKDIWIELISGPTKLLVTADGDTFQDALYNGHASIPPELVYPGGILRKIAPTVAGLAVGADGEIELSCTGTNAEVNVILLGVG